MTASRDSDINDTEELIRQRDNDKTWLRHSGQAADLDRMLLQGATSSELEEARKNWKGHIRHLRKEHGLNVVESPRGFWKLVSGRPTPNSLVEEPGATDELECDDDYEDVEPPEGVAGGAASIVGGRSYLRLDETARALAALAKEGLLGNTLFKASVGMLIRQASESNHWHNCAHHRSEAAAKVIRAERRPICRRRFKSEPPCRSNIEPVLLLTF